MAKLSPITVSLRFKDEAKLCELLKALAFYANPDTYFATGFAFDPPCGDFADDFEELPDGSYKPGKLARRVLGDFDAERDLDIEIVKGAKD